MKTKTKSRAVPVRPCNPPDCVICASLVRLMKREAVFWTALRSLQVPPGYRGFHLNFDQGTFTLLKAKTKKVRK